MSSGSREMMERMRAQIERLEFQVDHLITLHILLREYVGEMQHEIDTLHMEVPVTFSQASHVAKNAMAVQMNETERLAIKAG